MSKDIAIPPLEPAERQRLQRLFDATNKDRRILPKSYQGRFKSAYRRTIRDLTIFAKHHPQIKFPNDSAAEFLRDVCSDEYNLFFQVSDLNSVCWRAHTFAKSLQAKAARNGKNGDSLLTD